MLKSVIRVSFALAVSLALAFGAFFGFGTSLALAAGTPATAVDGIGPVASGTPDMGYCYPSGYNRQGWRCGWRLAMAPYNLGDAARYGYYGNYGYGYYGYYGNGYYPYYNYGYCNNGAVDYGGRPRYGPYNYYYGYYNPCW